PVFGWHQIAPVIQHGTIHPKFLGQRRYILTTPHSFHGHLPERFRVLVHSPFRHSQPLSCQVSQTQVSHFRGSLHRRIQIQLLRFQSKQCCESSTTNFNQQQHDNQEKASD